MRRRVRAEAMHAGTAGGGHRRARTARAAANAATAAGHSRAGLRLAFLSAAVSLVILFAAAAAPIPLYNIYRAEDGFTNPGISMAIVTYSLGAIVGLLVLGRM